MAPRNKPYEQFGPYLLFKKLESDSLSELWRAARIDNDALGGLVALRRFTIGSSQTLAAAVAQASLIVPELTGTSFARSQAVSMTGGIPFIVHDYSGGRSLRHIVSRARGANGSNAHPIPLDHAVAIAQKVALSLATTAELRYGGRRLSHGALLPQFIWISDEGEIRVAGQQLGEGLLASMSDARVAAEIGRYFSPESRATGDASKTSDVYSLGAIFHLLITGNEPPDATSSSAFVQALRAAKTMSGGTVPEDVRSVLLKCLNLDPASRYATIAEAKQALSDLAASGGYAATTFNLAFYISTLLKKEIEAETIERDKESKVNLAPYLQSAGDDAAPGSGASVTGQRRSSKTPLAVAAAAVLAIAGSGIWWMLSSHQTQATPVRQAITAAVVTPAPKPAVVSQPLVASPAPAAQPAQLIPTATAGDEAARKKAFEDAVQQELQKEMMKLQADYNRQLQQQQSKHAPLPMQAAPAAPPPAPVQADNSLSAAQLDQQRLTSARQEPALPIQQQPAAAAVVTPAPVQQQQAAAPPPVVPAVHEGDVIDVQNLDTPPHVVRAAAPAYPVMAARQKIETTILLTVLISETGEVLDVRVLRGDKRFGFEEAAIRAVRSTRFSPAIKDGKRVKTWFPIPVAFKV